MLIRFHRTPLSLPNLILIGVFAAASFELCAQAFYAVSIVSSGDSSTGKVTSIERRGHRRSAPYYHFSYFNTQGVISTAVTKYPCFFLTQLAGEVVPVRIRNSSAEISSVNYLWGTPAVLLCLAVFSGWIGWRWCRENISFVYNDKEQSHQ